MSAALVAAAARWWLAGLGATVGATTYPAFADVSAARWSAHHRAHQRRITLAVGPAWAVQGGATLWWLVSGVDGLSLAHGVAALTGVVLTVVWAVPAHHRLSRGFTGARLRTLLAANAWRTGAFAAAAVLATAGAA